jgi:hypothetical protein
MANSKKKSKSRSELRNLRIQQLLFIVLAIIVILSMVIGLVAN